ncbi:hypothetical protein [Thiomicrorhabdus sediminis]|uniref:Uncharacterized protein n=1 Tax=Thiomicrorhabdus sediminis TaxID=2580412 RepID=A0A4P9K500_9GAMM|nr:hypothetical protein [Thiomicrorhabdus sediminis]QCU90039.1 hypothetical protein FE785_05025 [Thiomicrorhabdus sediminis]
MASDKQNKVSTDNKDLKAFKALLGAGGSDEEMSGEEVESLWGELREKKEQRLRKEKRQEFWITSFFWVILALALYGLYLLGAFYSGLLLIVGSVLGFVWIYYDGKQSAGGNWATWILIPFVAILFLIGMGLLVSSYIR